MFEAELSHVIQFFKEEIEVLTKVQALLPALKRLAEIENPTVEELLRKHEYFYESNPVHDLVKIYKGK